MFRIDSRLKVFLHREAVDGRKSINGLALLVEQGLAPVIGCADPYYGSRPRVCQNAGCYIPTAYFA